MLQVDEKSAENTFNIFCLILALSVFEKID